VPAKILLVDDEYASLEALALLFRKAGYEVLTASDGDEALQRLREGHVQLVITDYKMPKLDGVALCHRLQEDEGWRRIPVIMMSATHGADVPTAPGVVAFVGKPFSFSVLLETVRQVLDLD
jgi:CheY-like chemotaxis protein